MEDEAQTTDGGQSAQADTPSAQPDTPPALLTPAVREPAYFGTPDGAPDGEIPALTAENLPWPKLLGAGRLVAEEAVGLSQLMLLCPNTLRQELSRSFLVSADNAHAVHPNHPEYADPGNAPVVNGGIALKIKLRKNQLRLSETSAAMAIFLGKNYLGQTDQPADTSGQNNELLQSLIDLEKKAADNK